MRGSRWRRSLRSRSRWGWMLCERACCGATNEVLMSSLGKRLFPAQKLSRKRLLILKTLDIHRLLYLDSICTFLGLSPVLHDDSVWCSSCVRIGKSFFLAGDRPSDKYTSGIGEICTTLKIRTQHFYQQNDNGLRAPLDPSFP